MIDLFLTLSLIVVMLYLMNKVSEIIEHDRI
jgi:hypothetical protein